MYQETAKCEVQTPKLQSSVQRINQVITDCFDVIGVIDNIGDRLYSVPKPDSEKLNKVSEPSDYYGALNQLEDRVRNLYSKLSGISNHLQELI